MHESGRASEVSLPSLQRTGTTTSKSSVETAQCDCSDDSTNLRSAALRTFKTLPRKDRQKVHVWAHIGRRLMRDESTKAAVSEQLGTLTGPQETVTAVRQPMQCQQLTALSALYKELIRTRAARKFKDVPRIAAAIKAKYLFRQAA